MSEQLRVESPQIEVVTSIGKVSLNYLNTRVRRFGDCPHANHVEYRTEDKQLKGFFPEPELTEVLFREDYPWLYLPKIALDAASIEFYDRMMYGIKAGL